MTSSADSTVLGARSSRRYASSDTQDGAEDETDQSEAGGPESSDDVGLGGRTLQHDVVLRDGIVDRDLIALQPESSDSFLHLIAPLDDLGDVLLLELGGPDPLDGLELHEEVADSLGGSRAARTLSRGRFRRRRPARQ